MLARSVAIQDLGQLGLNSSQDDRELGVGRLEHGTRPSIVLNCLYQSREMCTAASQQQRRIFDFEPCHLVAYRGKLLYELENKCVVTLLNNFAVDDQRLALQE